MLITVMKSKIHRARVTQSDLNYEGSISIDKKLLEISGIIKNEMVDVLNINNGERFTTYAIEAEENSGEIKINGAAARKVQVGDLIIIVSFASMNQEEAKNYSPKVVNVDENNVANLI